MKLLSLNNKVGKPKEYQAKTITYYNGWTEVFYCIYRDTVNTHDPFHGYKDVLSMNLEFGEDYLLLLDKLKLGHSDIGYNWNDYVIKHDSIEVLIKILAMIGWGNAYLNLKLNDMFDTAMIKQAMKEACIYEDSPVIDSSVTKEQFNSIIDEVFKIMNEHFHDKVAGRTAYLSRMKELLS